MKRFWPLLGALFTLAAILCLYHFIGLRLLAHSPYDSYSLQAQAWLDGKTTLDGDYPYLELARFGGKQFLSFPPLPSVFMLPFVLVFGQNAPSGLIAACLMLLSYCAAFSLGEKLRLSSRDAAFCAVFAVLGCNYAEFGLYGGVWNLAQSLSFLLTLLAFRLALSHRRAHMGLGLFCIACAVGCRPFQAFYAPLLTFVCWRRLGKSVARTLPLLIAPLLVAAAYAAYNAARFGNPLEFGHNYLPEFTEQSAYGQFSVRYMAGNLRNILRMPYWENGRLLFPTAFGFAFWLCNPLFVLFAWRFGRKIYRGRAGLYDGALFVALALHFCALLCHKSFGGVQFGTRYLCDLVPAMAAFYFAERAREPLRFENAVTAFAVAFNLYGAVVFHSLVD